MGLEIKEYKGSIETISSDEMWGDGFWTDDGWVAVVGMDIIAKTNNLQ